MRKTLKAFIEGSKAFHAEYHDPWIDQELPITSWRIRGYRFLGYGRGRMTFKEPNGSWVLKIPYNRHGIEDNRVEAKIYKSRRGICFPENPRGQRGRLTKCTRVNYFGVPCIRMEFLRKTHLSETIEYPAWVYGLDDGEQVGYDAKGRLKVFDYALEPIHRLKSYLPSEFR